MKRQIKKLFLLLFAIGTWAGAKADDAGYILRVNLTDGTVDEYLVADHPNVSFSEDGIYVRSSMMWTEYAIDDVANFTFADASTTAIEEVASAETKADISITYTDGENVIIRGITPDTPVRVYSLGGQMQNADITRTEGGANVSLNALPSGTYIINIKNDKSIKVLKR